MTEPERELAIIEFGKRAVEADRPLVFTPGFEAESFTELKERIETCSGQSDVWRKAGLWALGVMKDVLGENWPGETWRAPQGRAGKPWATADLCGAHSHVRHYARLLELALWLEGMKDVPGIAPIRKALRDDRTPSRWEHTRLQLEVGALARGAGWAVGFEGASPVGERVGGWPADVRVVLGGRRLAIETFAILPSDSWLAAVERTDEIQAHLRQLEHSYQVPINVDFGSDTLEEEGALERFFTAIEFAAAIVGAGAETQVVREGRAVAQVGRGFPSGFSGPPLLNENAWTRVVSKLHHKRQQVGVSSDPVWLRVDVLEGLWQFTPWAAATLAMKLDMLVPQLEQAIGGADGSIAGAVVSCGSLLAQGRFEDEDVSTLGGCWALRRNLAPSRVRETLVIPFRADARDDGVWLAELYANEPVWLSEALEGARLPSLVDIFPPGQPIAIISFGGPAQRWKQFGG